MPPIKHFIAVLYDRTAVHFEPEYSESSFFIPVIHSFTMVCSRISTEWSETLDKGCSNLAGIDEFCGVKKE